MKEHLLKIDWFLASKEDSAYFWDNYDDSYEFMLDLEDKNYTLLDSEGEFIIPKKPVVIQFKGLGDFFEDYCHEVGEELISDIKDETVKNYIIDYINSELNPQFSFGQLLEAIQFKQPVDGTFFLVFKINTYKSNHPEDPVEYDMDVKCVGVLGKHVKLVYK